MAAELDLDDVAAQSPLAKLELARLRKDAERYRWLRDGRLLRQGHDTGVGQRKIAHDSLRALMSFSYWCSADELDTQIDTALSAVDTAVGLLPY
jgi:hypothetical protein